MQQFFKVEAQPSVHPFGIRISEPITALTGLFITFFCWYAWMRTHDLSPHPTSARVAMQWFFVWLGLSNIFGGLLGHAFLHHFDFNLRWKLPGWWSGMLGVAFLAEAAILHAQHLLSPMLVVVLRATNVLILMGLGWLSFRRLNFRFVEMHAAIGILGLMLPLEGWLLYHHQIEASLWMLLGVVPAVLAVLLHIAKFSLSRWCNFFDLGHLLLCATVWYFMLGAAGM